MGAAAIPALAWASLATTAAAAGYAAYSERQSGRYAQAVANRNAEESSAGARDAIQRGDQEAAAERDRARRMIGSQRAAIAGSGISLDSGSALDLLVDTAGVGELEALTARNNAAREAYGYKTQSANLVAEGRLRRLEGRGASRSALLTGTAGALGTYQSWKTK